MNKEQEIIRFINDNFKELKKEAYGERQHGNKEMLPNIYHFYTYFKKIYNSVYELEAIEGQKYIPQEHIKMIYDVERNVEGILNYQKESKKHCSEILEDCYLKILGNLSCIMNDLD